jgi:L-alanine-DL-glutamate epimerase-like enolase superfamily enzyme
MDRGFTWLKMDLGMDLVQKISGTLTHPLGSLPFQGGTTMHMFTGNELTDKGIQLMADYVAQVREVIGMEVPLSMDHFGHIGVNSCIRLGRALEKYNPSWLEDMIPWQQTQLWKEITDALDVPTATGEDIFLKEPFEELCRNHAVDIIHPDLATAGGILETKKIGDMAQGYGVAMAMHFAGTPVSMMANVHCAAATENVLVLEFHSADVPWWESLVDGIEKPIIHQGFVRVPEKPGLGITLNEEAVKQHLAEPGYFAPSSEWDKERSWDRLWS